MKLVCGWLAAAVGLAAMAADARASARAVMGFLPHWERSAELHWDVLDVVAYFDVGVGPDGSLGSAHGWPDNPAVVALIERADQEGKRAVLTVTNFSPSEIGSLVQSRGARQRFIDEIVPLVRGAGGHGVNIDLEGVRAEDREAFTLFVTEVAAAFHNADPSSHVSVAIPAVDWSDVFDTAALLEAADALFIMGYDYHWRGGAPGPVAPLSSGELWPARLSLARTIADYAAPLAREDRRRLILGLPLYGYDWPADSEQPGAEGLGRADSVFFRDFATAGVEPAWDVESATPWYAYQDGDGWRQVWSENVTSLSAKLDLAVEHDLGIGFWALGYADSDPELWAAVAERANTETPPPPPDGSPDPDPGPAPDAGVDLSPDAGPGGGADTEIGGAGCRSAGASGLAGALWLLPALMLAARRRRRCA